MYVLLELLWWGLANDATITGERYKILAIKTCEKRPYYFLGGLCDNSLIEGI